MTDDTTRYIVDLCDAAGVSRAIASIYDSMGGPLVVGPIIGTSTPRVRHYMRGGGGFFVARRVAAGLRLLGWRTTIIFDRLAE